MRHLSLILVCLVIIGNLSAQELSKAELNEISKSEKKVLMLQIKDLKKNPEKLKQLKDNATLRDLTIEQQTNEISILKNDMQSRNLYIANLSDRLNDLNLKLNSHPNGMGTNLNSGTYVAGDAPLDHTGSKYRIQIGVFKNFNITPLFDEPKYIVHEDVNGIHRYSVGNFNSKQDAEAFKTELRRLGIKDAFVTTYIEGTRDTDIKPVSQPTVIQVQKVVVQPKAPTTGFNVKPAKQTPVRVNILIESNPFPVANGQVISTKPVQVDTKKLNDNIQQKKPVQEKVVVPVKETVVEPVREVEERPSVDPPKLSGIKINVGP